MAGMPWIPANMTDERRKKVEAFARYRRVSRHEAAALLIDAGIEALRPVIDEELIGRRRAIAERVLPLHRPDCPCVSCAADRIERARG